MKISRKQFLESAVVVAGAAIGGVAAAGCASQGTSGTASAAAGGPSGPVSACGVEVTPVLGHTHEVNVPAKDVNGGAEQTYETSSAAGHTHMLTLKREDFRDLALGREVSLQTTTTAQHRHDVKIVCE